MSSKFSYLAAPESEIHQVPVQQQRFPVKWFAWNEVKWSVRTTDSPATWSSSQVIANGRG